tara:strand:+ start:1345 stop:1491 length:147 start_codon:yes stop_codon:yes gene_type:complete
MKYLLLGALLFAPAASAHVTGTDHTHDHSEVIEVPLFCIEDEQEIHFN